MLKSQAETLNSTGLALLAKATECTKPGDVKSFTELGMKCLEESRSILSDMRSNSILVFIECGAHVGISASGRYGIYLDFCARNGLEIFSEKDFEAASKQILG